MTIRFGLIGCGRIAKQHIATLQHFENARIVALSDPILERMEESERQYVGDNAHTQLLKKYSDHSNLLLDADVDVVVIATATGSHAAIATQALIAGKHVIIEKPLALTLQEAKDVHTLAEANNRIVLVCHQLRYRPLLSKVKQLVAHGLLGNILYSKVSLRLYRSQEYYEASTWRGTWEHDGGMLLNQGIHMVDLLIWLMGDIEHVYGAIMNKGTRTKETEDAALGLIGFQSGRYGLLEANTVSHPFNIGYELSVFGEQGTIVIGGEDLDTVVRWSVPTSQIQAQDVAQLRLDKNERRYMYDHFLASVKRSKTVEVNANEAAKSLEAIFALYQSALNQKLIKLPLPAFSTVWMKGKERNRPEI